MNYKTALKSGMISILGQPVKIVNVVDLSDNGSCETDKMEIHILYELPENKKEEILLHEIIHYISDCLMLELTETQVNNLAVGLLSVKKIKKNNKSS